MKSIEITAEETKASLFAAEGGFDLTIASVAATVMRLAADRVGADVQAHVTQRAMEQGSNLVVTFVQGRRQLLRFHDCLGRTAVRAGVPAEIIGPNDKPTDGEAPPPMMVEEFAPGIEA